MRISGNERYEPSRYYTRLHYFGKLLDWLYVGDKMVVEILVYSACEHCATTNKIRLYVPTGLEDRLSKTLVVGDKYYIIAAPYKLQFDGKYKHRVDILLNIFQEII